jgi:hypothetical protein
MITKIIYNFRFYRIALLTLALVLTGLGMLPKAMAACTPGATRTIILDPTCCGSYPPPKAWKQNQYCGPNGIWFNSGGTYCGSVSACAI